MILDTPRVNLCYAFDAYMCLILCYQSHYKCTYLQKWEGSLAHLSIMSLQIRLNEYKIRYHCFLLNDLWIKKSLVSVFFYWIWVEYSAVNLNISWYVTYVFRCQIAVHQECYGARHVRDFTSWVCKACETPDIKRECCLCPVKGKPSWTFELHEIKFLQ